MSAAPGAAPAARLLVVDDIEMNRELLVRRVARLGHESATAENGELALACLQASPFDLVLLDINMPVMDGYEALRRIKADPGLAHIPVLMVSAIDEVESVVRCLELGAQDYITKPFNPVLLQARIEAALARKRLADQEQATLRALARELDIGHRIQRGFLPDTLPALEGWELAAHCEPARQVGGDFYDAMTLADGRLAFVVADVCDKGVGAALYMALFRTLLRAQLWRAGPGEPAADLLAQTLATTNDYIVREHGRDNMFATLFAGILEPASGRLTWANLGHDAPLLLLPGGRMQRLAPGAPACGLLAGVQPAPASAEMAPGALLLLFTDGATEARGAGGAFGEEPLLARASAEADQGAQALVQSLVQALAAHAGGQPPHDDLTLMALRRRPVPA